MPPTMSNAGRNRASKFLGIFIMFNISAHTREIGCLEKSENWIPAFARMSGIIIVLFFVTLFNTRAHAFSDEIVEATAGEWLVAPADGTQGCRVHLKTKVVIGGYAAEQKMPCAASSPLYEKTYAWDFDGNGGVVLRDATRKTLLNFAEQEGGPYTTPAGFEPAMLMVKAPQGVDRAPSPKKLIGAWDLADKNGKRLCGVELLGWPPGGEESFMLTLSKQCNPAIAKLNLASWRIEDFNLALYGSDGESLIMTPQANGSFLAENGMHLTRATIERKNN